MDFLMKYNITGDEVEKITEVNHKEVIKNIVLNKKRVMEVIDYLVDLGIKVESLRDLFIYQIGLFFRSKKEIVDAFEEYEMDSIVKALNYDVNTIDLIEFE